MLHGYRSDHFDDDKLYQVDGELLNMIVQLCKYFGRDNSESHGVINFVLGNLLQAMDFGTEDGYEVELNDEDFRAEMKKLGVIVPRR